MNKKILKDASAYYIHTVNRWGRDYGGSQNDEEVKEKDIDITEEMILVEDGKFAGVVIREEYREYNGGHQEMDDSDKILRISDIGTAAGTCRTGEYFGNDDHERWDITEYTLKKRLSRFEPLWKWIAVNGTESFRLTFDEVEAIAGVPIDHSFLTCKKELEAFGFRAGKISMKEQIVSFEKLGE